LPDGIVRDVSGEVSPIVVMGMIPVNIVKKEVGRCWDVMGEISITVRLDRGLMAGRSNWRGSRGEGSSGGGKVGVSEIILLIIKGGKWMRNMRYVMGTTSEVGDMRVGLLYLLFF
jgi:hypothetical protein